KVHYGDLRCTRSLPLARLGRVRALGDCGGAFGRPRYKRYQIACTRHRHNTEGSHSGCTTADAGIRTSGEFIWLETHSPTSSAKNKNAQRPTVAWSRTGGLTSARSVFLSPH